MSVNVEMAHIHCAECGILFSVTEDFQERRRKDHRAFFCPSGHSNFYRGESEEEKYKRLWREEKERRAAAVAREDQARAQLAATRGVVTKQRRKLKEIEA